MSDYLSAKKREQVEELKLRILAGDFNTPMSGYITEESMSIQDIIHNAVYQDEQGPWSLEDPYTELDIAQCELAIEAHDRALIKKTLKHAQTFLPFDCSDKRRTADWFRNLAETLTKTGSRWYKWWKIEVNS